MEDSERIADSEEVGDPTFEMPGFKPGDTQPLTRPVKLEPMDSKVPEFVAPPDMVDAAPLPDPFEDDEEDEEPVEEVLPPLEAAELALEGLRAEAAELSERLDSQSQTLMAANRRAVLSAALFMILVSIYMVWTGAQLKVAFRPEAVADAATGVARDAIPQAAFALQLMLEDGAADIAESFGEDLVQATPGYREALIQDLDPALAALSAVMVERLYKEILETPVSDYAETEAGSERSRALDAMLGDLDVRLSTVLDDRVAASRIAAAQALPSRINRGLRIRQSGRQADHERELLLMWLTVIAGR